MAIIKQLAKYAVTQVGMAAIRRVSNTAGDEIGKAVVKEGSKKIAENIVKKGEDGKIAIPTNIGSAVELLKDQLKKKTATPDAEQEVAQQPIEQKVPVQIPTANDGDGNVVDKLSGKAEEFGSIAQKSVQETTEKATKTWGSLSKTARQIADAAKKGYKS